MTEGFADLTFSSSLLIWSLRSLSLSLSCCIPGVLLLLPLRSSQPPYRDGKRVLECLQKSLRIASSCIDELTSVQLYVDALDRYIYYFEQGVEAVTPKYVNSLVELITSNIDSVHSGESSGSASAGAGQAGLVDGVGNPEMIMRVRAPPYTPLRLRKFGGERDKDSLILGGL